MSAPINKPATILFTLTTLGMLTVFPWYAWQYGFDWIDWVMAIVLLYLNGLSITGGYHRLWSHRAYEAHGSLKLFYMLFGAMGLQNSILVWASMHRVHHKHVDDVEHDPYSAKKGLWYSHMGWMLRDYPCHQLDYKNAKDLLADPYVAFQHKYYLPLALGMNFGVPILLGWLHGNIWSALLLSGLCRLFVSHHVTFFINSLAHFWGKQPYTTSNSARDNGILALVTYGEGYHNYHHLFQWDYRNGIRWWHFDPTKWLILSLSWVKITRNLRRVPEFNIQKALVQRQFECTKAQLARCKNPTRLQLLQERFEQEAQSFAKILAEWANLQQSKLESAKQNLQTQLQNQWENTDFAKNFKNLEENLRLQMARVRLLRAQAR